MPLYEYECKKCHHRFEELQKFSDPPIRKCPKCKKGMAARLPSAPAVHFKGSGWYVTDYGRKNAASGGSDKEGSKEGAKEGSKETGSKDDKGPKEPASDAGGKKDSAKKSAKKD